jgi:predicted RNA binding protein YcfA (HicA-like mRNA interferase family)
MSGVPPADQIPEMLPMKPNVTVTRLLVDDPRSQDFINRGGKGSHRNFIHPKGIALTISGQLGDDAKQYQEKDGAKKIEESLLPYAVCNAKRDLLLSQSPHLPLYGSPHLFFSIRDPQSQIKPEESKTAAEKPEASIVDVL